MSREMSRGSSAPGSVCDHGSACDQHQTRNSKLSLRPLRRIGQVSLATAMLALAGGSASTDTLSGSAFDQGVKTFAIDHSPLTVHCKEGSLRLQIDVSGEIDCVDKSTVESTCDWTVRIIDCVEQGAFVKEGDVVMTLDSSNLATRAQGERVDVVEAQAQLDMSRERLALQKLNNESRIAKAVLKHEFAKLDLESFRDGDLPRLKSVRAGNVEIAREGVVRAREAFDFTSRMARKGYESSVALEAERIKLRKAEHRLALANDQFDLLRDHEQSRTLVELEARVERAQQELDRANAEAGIAIRSREMDVVVREKRLKSQQDYLDRLENAIAACSVVAPRSGRVVLARPRSSRSAGQTLQPGEMVYRRQALFDIPRFDELNVEVKVHETLVRHIEPGQPAEIRIDARPDSVYTGEVVSVASVPTSGSYPNYDLKVYKAVVRITADPEQIRDLRPGLTARTTIIAEEREGCHYVPTQAIANVKGQPSVFVANGRSVEVRPVDVGMTTESQVEIVDGLTPNDIVVLSPKTEFSEQLIAMMK